MNHKRTYRNNPRRRAVDPVQAAQAQASLALPSGASGDRWTQRGLGHGLRIRPHLRRASVPDPDGRRLPYARGALTHAESQLPRLPSDRGARRLGQAEGTAQELAGRQWTGLRVDNVLLSEEGRLARQQVSVREHAPAVCLSSTSIQAAPADPEELSAIANTGSSRRASRRGPHRPQHEMSIQAGDPSIVYRVVVLTPSRLC